MWNLRNKTSKGTKERERERERDTKKQTLNYRKKLIATRGKVGEEVGEIGDGN